MGRLQLIVVIHHDFNLADGIRGLVLLELIRRYRYNARQVGSGNQARIVEIDLGVIVPTLSAVIAEDITNDRMFASFR